MLVRKQEDGEGKMGFSVFVASSGQALGSGEGVLAIPRICSNRRAVQEATVRGEPNGVVASGLLTLDKKDAAG